jgi:murein DD-endopeptidase MepM/ murein hydrolase activator NlpD
MSRRTGGRSLGRDLSFAALLVVGLLVVGAAFLTTSTAGTVGDAPNASESATDPPAAEASAAERAAEPATRDAENEASGAAKPAEGESSAAADVERDAFGIRTDLFNVETRRVRRHQTFADLLLNQGVSYRQIVALADSAASVYDVRRIQAGKRYRIYRNPWLQRARYLVYQPDPRRYVVFDVRHPGKTRIERRDVSVSWKTVAGTIETSLWQTLVEQGGQPRLALQLSEVFGWQIDFFRIRRGDRFRLVYEQRTIDGEVVGPGPIVAAVFHHRGEAHYGFRFDAGEGPAEYFDRDGGSLRRQLLKAPLRFSRISSRFSHSRLHPILNERRPHHGTDYAAPRGTPVRSVGEGTVLVAGYRQYNGNYVKIRHNAAYTTGYLHLADIASGIRPGATVEQGEVIGTVGSTGRSTGPHLDYRLWKHGTPVDPYSIELPPVRPVAPQHREAFEDHVAAMMDYLQPSPVVAREVPPAGAAVPQS